MTFAEFKESLRTLAQPPAALPPSAQALWHAGKDEWERAHRIAQGIADAEGAWVHAHLHRREGDDSNADYWYARSGRRRPALGLEQEWEEMVKTLLKAD